MKPPVDFAKQPWKHPVCWKLHLVRMTRDYPAGKPVSVATCECGWLSRMPISQKMAREGLEAAFDATVAIGSDRPSRRH